MKKLSLLTALLLLALSLPAGAKTDKNLLNYVDPLSGQVPTTATIVMATMLKDSACPACWSPTE